MGRFIPLIAFVVLGILLGIGLTLDPKEVPSPFIGKPAPDFRLAKLNSPEEKFSPADFKGKVWLLNVWATWCVSCRAEHEVLKEVAQLGVVDIVGLNYKDEPADARAWLRALGNPYQFNVEDRDGRVGIDWGVYGTPETFVIDREGIIRYKQIGPVSAEVWIETLQPLITKLKAEGKA